MTQETRPIDWSAWQQYREAVEHPCAAIKAVDLDRARRNVEQYEWASDYVAGLAKSADSVLDRTTPEYLENMIPRTTPGCTGPCPACRAKGLPWHPNGQWTWSESTPDQITCKACETVFPNDEHPETVKVRSTWDPEQEFTFVGGETFKCFGYTRARPSISGIIRARKVGRSTSHMSTLALAYALTSDPRYAEGTKSYLLRFAEVYPKYLVRAGYGYGEYTDCDPHLAAEHINDLPTDELVYPPNKPDRKLYAGYWAASRTGSSGMDGGFVSSVAQAYDLTCTAEGDDGPVYSDTERVLIEHDLLLEASYLAACDLSINNKSVGNRAGAAMVGMVVGHPGLVRFGLNGFERTVDGWFLPDGGSSESPAYAMMTMGGIRNFALMFRGHSDPEGYAGPDGERLDNFDAGRDTRYGDCWQDLIWTLQGNLRHPPSADSYRTTGISSSYAELIAVAYPTDEHLAFLKALVDGAEKPGSPRDATLYREPGVEDREVPPFALPDIVFPYLAQGYVRTGETGRESVALLNASDWGGHHHHDSLDLYYWKDGRELLSDLGYLWDHPEKPKTTRAFAHNLVLVGGADQKTRERGGSYHIFSATPKVKVMEASSIAYDSARAYRRTCVQVDHGESGSYLVDIFRADADAPRQYVFHGPTPECATSGLGLGEAALDEQTAPFAVRFHLSEVGEIFVDDIEIRRVNPDGSEGDNIAPNPSAIDGAGAGTPENWGIYRGNGAAEHSSGEPGRDDAACARFAGTAVDADGHVNAALIAGDSDGYRGVNAIPGVMGATYKVRFWLRGDGASVNAGIVTWPADPTSPSDRVHKGMARITATDEWTQHETSFTLAGGALPMDNMQQAAGDGPWHVEWVFDDGYRFRALSPDQSGETVFVGDGWGQRDHRNSDVGATLPYIVREIRSAGSHAFVSVFAGAPDGQFPVEAVRVLDAPGDAVAVEIDTADGTDVVVSMIGSQDLSITTSRGELRANGRVAAVLASGAASMTGGTRLSLGDTSLSADQATYAGDVAGRGSEGGDSWFDLSGDLPEHILGQTLLITDGDHIRAYPIRGLDDLETGLRVFTKVDHVGFEARDGDTYEFLPTVTGGG